MPVGSEERQENGERPSNPKENHMAAGNKWMINPNDAVMALVDHQSGLFQLVRDIDKDRE